MARGKRKRQPRCEQLRLDRNLWGGYRPGSGGRKKKEAGVSHARRRGVKERFPVHVTVKLRRGLPSIRDTWTFGIVSEAVGAAQERAGRLGAGFRIAHYSVQVDHVHLIVEASDRLHLSRGMQGFQVRLARALNRAWGRKGRVFADRYHDHVLETPTQVRNALRYVLKNGRHHGNETGRGRPDPYSSGESWDGWSDYRAPQSVASFVLPALTWLLRTGWRRAGPVELEPAPI